MAVMVRSLLAPLLVPLLVLGIGVTVIPTATAAAPTEAAGRATTVHTADTLDTAPAAAPRLRVSPARPLKGERTAFTGKAPGASGRVVLQRKAGQRWRKVATGKARRGGYRIEARVRRAGSYRVQGGGFTSRPRKVALARQKATLRGVAAPFVVGHPRTVRATVKPARKGRKVRLQVLDGGTWATVAAARSRANGTARIAFEGTTPGTADYRVVGARFRGAAASPPSVPTAVHTARQLDVASRAAAADSRSGYADVSADGRWLAFASDAQLLPADGDLTYDIYLLDRVTGSLEGVLLDSNDTTVAPSLSADGRYIAFQSVATNLGSGGDVGYDVYVLDRRTDAVELVSRTPGGGDGNGASAAATISDDGRYVVWVSTASNLVTLNPPPGTSVRHGWVRDRETGITRPLDRIGAGWADEDIDEVTISGDGSRIAFSSGDEDLDPPGGSIGSAVFTWDVAADGTLSERTIRTPAYYARDPHLTADGDTFVFATADDLVPPDVNGDTDVYVQPVDGGSVTLASPAGGAESSRSHGISADGRYVLMTTRNQLPGDGNGLDDDVVVWDSVTGTHRLLTQGNGPSLDPAMSADGSVVGFTSEATNLIGPSITGDSNVFVSVLW